jgi:hypothetical protein
MVLEYLHVHTCLYEGAPCVGCAIRGDNAVNRTMVQVVDTVVCIFGDACRVSVLLYCFLHNIHTVGFGLK